MEDIDSILTWVRLGMWELSLYWTHVNTRLI